MVKTLNPIIMSVNSEQLQTNTQFILTKSEKTQSPACRMFHKHVKHDKLSTSETQ